MNAFIQLVKQKVAPNDPPLNFETWKVDDFCDEVLTEALNLRKVNPVLDAKTTGVNDDIESTDVEEDIVSIEDEFELDINSNCSRQNIIITA